MSKSKQSSAQITAARQSVRNKQIAARKQAALKRNALLAFGALVLAVVVVGAVIVVGRWASGPKDPVAAGASGFEAPYVQPTTQYLLQVDKPKVMVVEFFDFGCGGCQGAHPIVKAAAAKYPKNVSIAARYFPLNFKNSETSARAAEAAGMQGKFKEMFNLIMENPSAWSQLDPTQAVGTFSQYAEQLKLDKAKFDKDYASAEVKRRIDADRNDGTRLGVQSTPSFFVNGQRLDSVTKLDQTIAGLLEA